MTLYLRNHFYGWVCLNFYVMVPKAHQTDNRSYVSSADLPSDSLRKILAWWAVTKRTSKHHKTVKIGGWVLAWVWALARDNTVGLSEKRYTS